MNEEETRAALIADPYHQTNSHFWNLVAGASTPGTLLEVGSRGPAQGPQAYVTSRGWKHYGVDIHPGENVDQVGDAHQLSKFLEPSSFDAGFSVSTFEHLLMPWKAAVEVNKVLKMGALFLVTSHQTWPVHEWPWDFFRFSSEAWRGLFNAGTGFEIVATAMGEPGSISAKLIHAPTKELAAQPCFLASCVIARKVSETTLHWDIEVGDIVNTIYPPPGTFGAQI